MREYLEKLNGFLRCNREEIFRTHRELCLIPAPSHFEDERAVYCKALLESFGYTCGKDGVSVISFDATYNALVYCQKGKIAMTVECNPLLGPLVESVIKTIESGQTPEKNRYVEETAFLPEDITEL